MNTGLAQGFVRILPRHLSVFPPRVSHGGIINLKFLCASLGLLLVVLAAYGADPGAVGSGGGAANRSLGRLVLQEIWRTQIHHFFLSAAVWTVLGGLIGAVTALLAILGARTLGWYRSGWKHAGWIRWSLWGCTVLACALLLGLAGFWLGVIRGSEQVLVKSRLGTQVFPVVGNLLADGIATLQASLSDTNAITTAETNLFAKIESFRTGTREVHAQEFVQQMDHLSSATITNLVLALEQEAMARSPLLRTGIANRVLHQALSNLGATLAQKKLESELKRFGVDRLYAALRHKLVEEARRQGNPNTINRQELSAFLVQEAIIPSLMRPIRSFAGSQALFFLLLTILPVVLPPVTFRLTCGRVPAAPAPPIAKPQE